MTELYQRYHLPVPEVHRELLRISATNPVWCQYMNQDFIDRCFKESAKANRAVMLNVPPYGSMFYLWCRAEGMDGLDMMSAKVPTPDQWASDKGVLYITDICYTPEVPHVKAGRAMIRSTVSEGIAQPGEKLVFLRTTPGRPHRVGWVTAR